MSILEGFKKLTTSRTLGMQIFKGVQVDGISDGRLLLSFEYRDDVDYRNKLEKLQKAFSSLRLGFFDTSKKDIGLSYSDAKIPNGTSATFAVDVQGITGNVEAPFLTFLASFSKSKTAVQDITGFDFKKLDKIPHATSASPQQDQAEAERQRQEALRVQQNAEAERQRQETLRVQQNAETERQRQETLRVQQNAETERQRQEALRVQQNAEANVVIVMPPQPPPRPKTRQKINQRNVTAPVLVAGGLLGTAGLAWWGWSNLVKNQTPIAPTASIPQKIDISGTFQTKTQNFATDVLQLKWGVKPASTDSFDLLKAAMANGGDAQGGSTANNVKTALEAIAKKYNSDRPGLNLNVDDMLAAYRQGREASAADVPSRINGALGGVQKYIDQHQKVAALPDTDNPLSTFLGNIGKKTQDVIGAILPRGEAAVAAEVNVGAKPQINGEGTNWLSGLSVLAAGSAIAELVSGTAKSNADKAHAITRLAATMPQNLQHFAAVAQNAAQIMPSVAKEALQAVASNIQHAAPALQHAAPLLTLAAVAADIYKSSRPEFLEKSKEAFAAAQERVAKAEAVTNASFTEHAGRLLRGCQRNAAALTLKKAEILNNGRENLEAGLQNIQKNMEALKTQTVQSAQGSIVVLQKNTEQMVSKVSHSVNELRNAVVQQSQGTLVSIQEAGSKTLDTLKGLFNRGGATRNAEQQALMEAQLAYVTSNVR
jgi:hypothetical protein